jgi:hypothetical protein
MGTHKTTLEFTKDNTLTPNGNCIIGVGADFSLESIKSLLAFDRLRVVMKAGDIADEVLCDTNRNFNDDHEMVIRMGTFDSSRTLGVNADKSSRYLKREMMERMKSSCQNMIVEIEGFNNG